VFALTQWVCKPLNLNQVNVGEIKAIVAGIGSLNTTQ
jgi:hypothetical protein